MLLYVMRHGPAEDRSPSGRDFDRGLTQAGRDVVARAAGELEKARGGAAPIPGLASPPPGPTRRLRVLSSPLRRARETADIVVGMLMSRTSGPLDVELRDELGADAGVPLGLVRELAAVGTDALLVGHQPTVEDLARQLLKPAPTWLRGGFRTATIVAAELVEGRWHLGAVLDPHAPDPCPDP